MGRRIARDRRPGVEQCERRDLLSGITAVMAGNSIAADMRALAAAGRINAAPDLTLRALAGELAEHGTVVSHWAVWKFCMNEGLSFKKKHSTQRAGSRRRRSPSRSMA